MTGTSRSVTRYRTLRTRASEHRMPGTREEARALGFLGLAARGHGDPVIGELAVSVLIPRAARIVVTKDGGRPARLVLQAELEVDFDETGEGLGDVIGGLEVVHHTLEPA